MSNFLITGYYFKGNLGDDLLMKVASIIFKQYKTQFIGIDTINIYNTSYIDELIKWTDKLILFGGEVINNFFLDKLLIIRSYALTKFNKFIPFYAIGVSCNSDYNEILPKVDIFETIVFRNTNDYRLFNNRFLKNNIYLLPDPVFYIQPKIKKKGILSKVICSLSHKIYNIGLYLSQTAKDKDIIKNQIIKLIQNNNYNLHLFTMCNGNIDNENDTILNENIINSVKSNNIKLYNNTDDVLANISNIDYAICWRFHAHVLCIQYNIPFISISDTPKVKNLMNEYNLQQLVYSNTDIINGLNYLMNNKREIRSLLSITYNRILLDVAKYNNLIRKMLNIRLLPKYYINIDDEIIYKKLIAKYKLFASNNNDFNATLLLYLITGKLKSSYHWGLLSKLNSGKYIDDLKDDIKWLINEEIKAGNNTFYYKMVEYVNYDIDYIKCGKNINIHYFNQDDMKGLHRSGWEYVISNIEEIATFNKDAILCDLYVDRTFHWNYDICYKLGIIPYTKKWIGFIHHTDNEKYTNYNIIELFKKEHFIESLKSCKGFIVLSKYLKNKLMNILIKNGTYHIPVFVLYHPTECVNDTFDISIFEHQKEHKVVQIGAWYRKIDAIFKLKLGNNKLNFKKYALNGPAMCGYYNRLSNKEDMAMVSRDCISRDNLERESEISEEELMSVELINELSASDYDKLLINCIIFIYLIDASAANTIIEAIVRNTPILINKIDPVVEYLGSGYPYYYESMEDATEKLNNMKLIKKTYEYLRNMDKSFLKIETFMNNLRKII
jgi:polysaccharide pyruvyl transferase WcaK-like protein